MNILFKLVEVAIFLACLWYVFLGLMFSLFDPRERISRDSLEAREARQMALWERQDSIQREQERLEKNRKHEAFLLVVQERKDSIRRFDSARIGYFLYRLDSVRRTGAKNEE